MGAKKIFVILLVLSFSALAVSAQLSMKKTGEGILITENGEAVLEYHTVPKSMNGESPRLNYIHPLYSLNGRVLTEDFPSDHPFHRGIFWAWRQLWIGDKRIGDAWELDHFEQSLSEFEFIKDGNGVAKIKTELDWLSDQWMVGGEKMPFVKERGTITVYPRSGNVRRIDFEIRLLALTEGVRIGGSEDEKGYGGFSVRLNLPGNVKFSGPGGNIVPLETPVVSKRYVNISGAFESGIRQGGIVIIDHPENPGFPQPWTLRAKKSMQNAVWPGRETVELPTKSPTALKYTLLVYSGKLSNRKIEKMAKNLDF